MTEANQYTQPFDREAPEEYLYGEPYSAVMRTIIAQWRESKTYWEKRYDVSRRDKKFVQSKQWDSQVEKERFKKGLATITWPLIRNFYNKQIGTAIPASVDFGLVNTDPRPNNENDTANDAEIDVLTGMMRYIDRQSKASGHRTKARKDQFSGGIGWLGVDYVHSDSSQDGVIKISSPKHFDRIYIDPRFNEPDASDAEYSFEINTLPYEVAVAKYGDRIKRIKKKGDDDFDCFENFRDCYDKISTLDSCNSKDWLNDADKTVKIAVHHWRRESTIVYYELAGETFNEDQWKEVKEQVNFDEIDQKPQRIEKRTWKVEQRTICGWSVLEEKEFFINRIPWTPVFGYTLEDGEDYTYHGIVHDGVQLQEHANWLASQHATKTSEAKTIALVSNGTFNDFGSKPTLEKGGITFIGVNFDADGTNQTPAQVIQSQDNGSFELQQLQFTIELLREIMSTSNDSSQSQIIQSAQQLQLHIQDRDSVREELDINYRAALETHYSKVVEMIKSVYDKDDIVKIVDLSDDVERIGAAQITDVISSNYSVSIKMSPSGTVQKQQAQQLASALTSSPDPARQAMGLIMSIDNSEISNKTQILKRIYKQQFAAGDISNIPVDIIQEIIQEQAQTGQIQQTLAQLAEPIAQQRLQQLMQDGAIQAQIVNAQAVVQKSQADVAKTQLQNQKADIDLQRSIQTGALGVAREQEQTKQDSLQLLQEQEQTKQDQLRTIQEFYEVQQKIAEAQLKGTEISAELISRLSSIQVPQSIQFIGSVQ